METGEQQITRNELIQWITELNDGRLLSFLNSVRVSTSTGQDWWNELSASDVENIHQGLKDIDAGRVHNSESFWNKLKNE